MALVVGSALLISCASPGFGPVGGLFTSTKIGLYGKSTDCTKTGKSCAQAYLGMVAVGDASAEEAMADGGITDVHTMNLELFSILGIFTESCTVVRGE